MMTNEGWLGMNIALNSILVRAGHTNITKKEAALPICEQAA